MRRSAWWIFLLCGIALAALAIYSLGSGWLAALIAGGAAGAARTQAGKRALDALRLSELSAAREDALAEARIAALAARQDGSLSEQTRWIAEADAARDRAIAIEARIREIEARR